MIEYTKKKQALQFIIEELFLEAMDEFDLSGFLSDPRGYTRKFMATNAVGVVSAVMGDAYKIGKELAMKAKT